MRQFRNANTRQGRIYINQSKRISSLFDDGFTKLKLLGKLILPFVDADEVKEYNQFIDTVTKTKGAVDSGLDIISKGYDILSN